MEIFYGAAIQGKEDGNERIHINRTLIETIKNMGHSVPFEHTTKESKEERARLLEKAIGPLPPLGIERTIYARRKVIEVLEGDIDAAIFEVSIPSLGTGIEITHAYLRPKMGLKEIPILLLYQKDYWSADLSSMIRGISKEEVPNLHLREYKDIEDAKSIILQFLKDNGK